MANIGGNFVNPAYASPQQIAALREYAKQLMTEQPVQHWAQGLGNIARALVGGHEARRADTEEQTANKEFAKELMDATTSKDPAKLMAAMSNPRAAGIQALLASKLLEWGPERGLTTPGGLGVRGPVEPYFNKEPTSAPQQFTPPPAQPSVPPAAPAVPPSGTEMSRDETIIPGSRTTTGSPDSAFDVIGKQFGVPNLGELNRAGMQQAAELEKMKAKSTLAGGQEQTATAQAPMISSVKQRIVPAVNTVLSKIQSEGAWPPLTGSPGYLSSHYPGTPANKLAKDISDIEDMITSQHVSELTAANPNRRIFPEEIQAWKRDQGLDITDRPKLIKNLQRLQREYGGAAIPGSPAPQQGGQGPFPAQAAESPGGVKILKVIPYGGQ